MADNILVEVITKGTENATNGYQQIADSAKKASDSINIVTQAEKDLQKATDIIAQSTDGLTAKQLKLRESINSVGGIIQKNTGTVRENSAMNKQLQTQLTTLIAEFDKETASQKKNSDALKENTTKQVSLRGEIKQSREELARMMATGELSTAQIYSMAKGAGNLKDAFGDASGAIQVLSSDTFALDATIQTVQSLTAGFQVFQGVQALVGDENKDLQQVLIKLNAVMAITSGLQQIQNNLQKNSAQSLGTATLAGKLWNFVQTGNFNAIRNTTTALTAETVATEAQTTATVASSTALKALRLAFLSVGIGLFIAGIVYLISNFDKLKESILGSTQSLKDFKAKQDEIREANKKSFDDYETEIKYLVNIKQLTQEQADLKLSIKRKEAEQSLKAVYDENLKKLGEYEQAIKNVTIAKSDGLTMSELEAVRAQQKYIPSQKELTAQKEITRQAEIDYKKAVNERIEAENKGGDKAKTKLDEYKTELEKLKASLEKSKKQLEDVVSKDVVTGVDVETDLRVGKIRNDIEAKQKQIKTIEDLLNPIKVKSVAVEIESINITSPNIIKQIEEQQKILEEAITGVFTQDKKQGINPKVDIGLNELLSEYQKGKDKLEVLKAELDGLLNPKAQTNELANIKTIEVKETLSIINFQIEATKNAYAEGLLNEAQYNERIKELGEKRNSILLENANKAQSVLGTIVGVFDQLSGIASEAIKIKTDNELASLDEKREKGLISEKKYQQESAKIKNEAAKKQRAFDIANAVAKIPQAVLSAYTAGLQIGGPAAPIVAGVLAGLAGAFGAVQVGLIASAPLPKFRHGGLVGDIFYGSGFVKGKRHEQGGVNAELEGTEFVHKREAVSKYGVPFLESINNLSFKMPSFPTTLSQKKDIVYDFSNMEKLMNENNDYLYKLTKKNNNQTIIIKENGRVYS